MLSDNRECALVVSASNQPDKPIAAATRTLKLQDLYEKDFIETGDHGIIVNDVSVAQLYNQ